MGILLPVLIFVVFYVLIILPQGRKRRQAAALQKAVEPGSRVLLTSGLYAIVVEIETDTIILEAAEGVHLRYAKAAVLRVVPHLDELDDSEYEDDEEDGHDAHDGHDHDHDAHDGHDHDDHDSHNQDDHDAAPPDEVARPSNREDHQGNDSGSGPVPQA